MRKPLEVEPLRIDVSQGKGSVQLPLASDSLPPADWLRIEYKQVGFPLHASEPEGTLKPGQVRKIAIEDPSTGEYEFLTVTLVAVLQENLTLGYELVAGKNTLQVLGMPGTQKAPVTANWLSDASTRLTKNKRDAERSLTTAEGEIKELEAKLGSRRPSSIPNRVGAIAKRHEKDIQSSKEKLDNIDAALQCLDDIDRIVQRLGNDSSVEWILYYELGGQIVVLARTPDAPTPLLRSSNAGSTSSASAFEKHRRSAG